MRRTISRVGPASVAVIVAVALGLASPPASGVSGPRVRTFDDPGAFQTAIVGLGASTVIDFEDIDAGPVNNTIVGREAFDGDRYAPAGIRFSSPHGHSLYIAPGGLFWNESNSLSVGRFPFDEGEDGNDDDLVVRFLPRRIFAVGFTLVDNGSQARDEFVRFLDPAGRVIAQVELPSDFVEFRAFVGVVSPTLPIATIEVSERAFDEDDVDYDDFIFVSRAVQTLPPGRG